MIVVGIDQSPLVIKWVVQYPALRGMLYIKEVVHEVHGTRDRVRALDKLLDLFRSINFPTMRTFDKDYFCALGHLLDIHRLGTTTHEYVIAFHLFFRIITNNDWELVVIPINIKSRTIQEA